jgi:2-octaprenyl-6-methoxyphenol hydroxylase
MQGSGMTGAGRTDVLISGAGFAGLALGAALAGAGLSVMIVDPSLGRPSGFDPRASTLVAGTRRLLEAIGAWDAIAPDAEPMLGMEITDGRLEQILRPVYLQIHGEAAPGEPFAHVAPNGLTKAALLATAQRAGVHLGAGRIADLRQVEGGAEAVLADGSTISARLVVAADGAQSTLRGMAGIASRGWRYDQSAIVTNVRLEKPHHGIAVQHFLEGGPLALLPLRGDRASIVWSERKFQALRLAELDDAGFRDALQTRAGHRFGQIALDGRRALRPLEFRLAADFARGRVALVGDAAHAIHPIAGQGLNLGLRDVAALAESVVDAARLGQDIGSDAVLARYSGWRRFDTALMTGAMDGLVQLFTTRSGPVRLLRDIGLGLVDRMPMAKRAFIRSAAGLGGEVPRLMRGETL